ncbi:CRISPR-associated endonuclease/helicase Cas3 [Trueperella bonasi]|uniref:CRISPR-associated endonuclease/helicase Cas3 n=1 Tax=Trueperella bonasi TaxID=312286 RepID=A0ABT9NES9_9ACTO|nr:CRISPR-associated helicase Cas3' [Trueperella bonasi]MDP9805894.1 CRISPR-associated endonuclease/helicase Cas3 [Trueperella bonasi]
MNIADQAETWLKSLSPQAHSLWAKSGSEDAYLRLPQHLIDTACVADWLWQNWVSDSLKRTMVERWGVKEESVHRLYVFFSGVHDVGKATVSFQRLVEHRPDSFYLLRPIEEAGLSLEWPEGEGTDLKLPHGTASAWLLKKWLLENSVSKRVSARLASVVDAHHGFTTEPRTTDLTEDRLEGRTSKFDDVAWELIDSMADLTGVRAIICDVKKLYADAAQLMTGLLIMADWIASNEDAFPYDVIIPQPDRLAVAMDSIDLPKPWEPVAPEDDTAELFGRTFDWKKTLEARPVQKAAVKIAREASGPLLMIIEAPTGEGKTEAGLAAAHVLGQKSGAQGVFLGAPTMATANGLLERVIDWARRSSQGGSVSSMYLAHSKNRLSKQFRSLHEGANWQEARANSEGSDRQENIGDLVANQWLSGSRKGLLSNFVVGTIDQVLMMALKVRFSMLRHVAFAGKVVIIDEVHAYDAYMSQYLYRVLQWLSRYGVSVILMSATLPPAQRKKLASAYGSMHIAEPDEVAQCLDVPSYPLISVVDREGMRAIAVPPRPDDAEISIQHINDEISTLTSTLESLLEEGGIALVICNTVKRAQDAYRDLRDSFPDEVELHHSAFIASHRSEKEDVLRAELGPSTKRGEGRPLRKVIVATQVAEQSLDIDADVLVTDIAPIDLIIQRAGRLHRHSRPEDDRPKGLRVPQIFIRGIERDRDVPEFDGGAVAIYGEKLLLATMAYMPDVIRRPSDVSSLVRDVYSDNPTIPVEWQERWDEACRIGEDSTAKSARNAETFRFPEPTVPNLHALFDLVHDDSPGPGDEQRGSAQVRDAEFSVEVIALRDTDHGYKAFGESGEILDCALPTYQQALELGASSVRLPARMTRSGSDFDEVISALESQTPSEWCESGILRGQVALRFDESGKAELGRFLVSYDEEVGLVVQVNDAPARDNSDSGVPCDTPES